MAVAGTDRVPVYSPCSDATSPSPFDGVVHTDDDRVIGHEPFDDNAQLSPGDGTRTPAGATEDLMIACKVGRFGPASHAQAGTDGSLARRQQSAHHQDEHMLPTRRREASTPWLQPLPQYLGNGIADNGFGMVHHPMLRIPTDTGCKAIALSRAAG